MAAAARQLPTYRLMRFSTDALAPGERFDTWRDQVSAKLWRIAIDPLTESPYRAKAALRVLPQLRVGVGYVSAAFHRRTRQIAAEDNDDVALMVNLKGPLLVRRDGADVLVEEGGGYLVPCQGVGDYVMAESARHLIVRLDRKVLGPFARHVDSLTGRAISAQTEALKLLVTYAATLPRGDWELSSAASQLITDHVGDLMALIIGARGEAAEAAQRRGLSAARLASAKADVRARSGEMDLSAEAVAGHQGISPRYLRQLFEAEEQSFGGYLMEQRLGHAYAMLVSRKFAAQPISHIAFEVGFGDLSYFNRAFRSRYDRAPRDVRAEARAAWEREP